MRQMFARYLVFLCCACFVAPAMAQSLFPKRAKIKPRSGARGAKKKPRAFKFDSKRVKINKKKKRRFKKITVKDLNKGTTGSRGRKKLTENSVITVGAKKGSRGKGGKKVKVKTYLKELNKLEKRLNKMGYSVRDRKRRS